MRKSREHDQIRMFQRLESQLQKENTKLRHISVSKSPGSKKKFISPEKKVKPSDNDDIIGGYYGPAFEIKIDKNDYRGEPSPFMKQTLSINMEDSLLGQPSQTMRELEKIETKNQSQVHNKS